MDAKYRVALEKLYTDRATIRGYVEVKKPSGETGIQLRVKYQNQPCRISQKALGSNGQTDTVNNIAYETKLFISPEIEIVQGDEIEVTRGTATRAYTAGEPFLYSTHQEVILQRKDKA